MNRMRIAFEEDRASFVPGERVSGAVTWFLMDPVESVELRLFWYTLGRGDQDIEIVDRTEFQPSQEGSGEFQWTLPRQPYSFSGKLISILWAVELVCNPGVITERLEIVVGPNKEEIRVDAGPG